ncbi:MAG TPA: chitobiase/beta-hexosaminidase C-terminal domain-containing protein [Methylomirabilota bacterium]|nr:chitobiase/beta-hexosaminidase C-terminal domain-containing protein [Methylomirabilota bacterium]
MRYTFAYALGLLSVFTFLAAGADSIGDGIPDSWRIRYFNAVDHVNAAAIADPDADGANNFREFLDGTDPTVFERIDKPSHLSTFAGSSPGTADGYRTHAQFNSSLTGFLSDGAGGFFLGEGSVSGWDDPAGGMQRIRHIDAAGVTTTFAGSDYGSTNGPREDAKFLFPADLVSDSAGNLFVMDRHQIRKIDPSGNVTTFAGSPQPGFVNGDGQAARFHSARAISIDAEDNLFVVDWWNNAIRKVTPAGKVTTVTTDLAWPIDIDRGPDGNFYIAEVNGGIVRMTPSGALSPFAAPGGNVIGISVDSLGNVYASIGHNSARALMKYSSTGTRIWSFAPASGESDGPISQARLNHIGKTYPMADGSVLIADAFRIRQLHTGRAPLVFVPENQQFEGSFTIRASSASSNGVLRYTVDGSAPTSASPALPSSLTITNTTQLQVRLFNGPHPLSDVVHRTFTSSDDAPPIIIAQPADVVAASGSTLALEVLAKGRGLQYVWFANGAQVPDSNTNILHIPQATIDHGGIYSVVINNAFGSAQSRQVNVLIGYTLTVDSSAGGTVTASPAASVYTNGSSVTLTATAAPGYYFDGWSDVDANRDAVRTVVLNSNTVSRASFAARPTFTLRTQGPGAIRLNADPNTLTNGQTVQITAEPAPGFNFVSWEGALTGAENPRRVLAQGSKQITAIFADLTKPVLHLDSPIDGAVSSERLTLSGSVETHAASENVQVRWSLNGSLQGPLRSGPGSFSVPFTLRPGANSIVVTAEDDAGNTATVEREVSWQPARTIKLASPTRVQEGASIRVPVVLTSGGDVSGMTLRLSYPNQYLADPELRWLDPAAEGLKIVNHDAAKGQLTATFSLGGVSIPEGVTNLFEVQFRARSVPSVTNVKIDLALLDSSDSKGNSHGGGSWTEGADLQITQRKYRGDNNANDRLDVGDASVLQRYLTEVEPVRSWDIFLNDLNDSTTLDAGDVTKVLRAAVGLDPQPRGQNGVIQAQALPDPTWVIHGALLNLAWSEDRSQLVVDVALTNLAAGVISAAFALEYDERVLTPANAAQATGLSTSGLNLSAITPAGVGGMKNLRFAFSSATASTLTNGSLARIIFNVNKEALLATPTSLNLHEVDISHAGYDLVRLPDVNARLEMAAPAPPRINIAKGGAAGSISLEVSGDDADYRVVASENLTDWVEVGAVSVRNGHGVFIQEPDSFVGRARFYRLLWR